MSIHGKMVNQNEQKSTVKLAVAGKNFNNPKNKPLTKHSLVAFIITLLCINVHFYTDQHFILYLP